MVSDVQARVEALGGQILFWNGVRVMGVLAVSRAIGDHCLRPFVIAQPEVRPLPSLCWCAQHHTHLLWGVDPGVHHPAWPNAHSQLQCWPKHMRSGSEMFPYLVDPLIPASLSASRIQREGWSIALRRSCTESSRQGRA